MENKCKLWDKYNLSWFGRTAAVKTILLPKLIFVIDIPEKVLNKIQNIINKFIWKRATPKLKLAITEKALRNGGVAIPNIKKYYNAACLSMCVNW